MGLNALLHDSSRRDGWGTTTSPIFNLYLERREGRRGICRTEVVGRSGHALLIQSRIGTCPKQPFDLY